MCGCSLASVRCVWVVREEVALRVSLSPCAGLQTPRLALGLSRASCFFVGVVKKDYGVAHCWCGMRLAWCGGRVAAWHDWMIRDARRVGDSCVRASDVWCLCVHTLTEHGLQTTP